MDKGKLHCGSCKYWITGIPAGRCQHPEAGFLLTPDKMVFEDSGEDCPLNSEDLIKADSFNEKFELTGEDIMTAQFDLMKMGKETYNEKVLKSLSDISKSLSIIANSIQRIANK